MAQVRSLTCPKCGGRTKLVHGEDTTACLHCGQQVRLSDAVREEQTRARAYPHQTPLRLGMKATYRSREYEAAGRLVLQSRDSEGELSTWEEWNLVSADGDLLFLEFDEGKWKLTEPFVPQRPVSPQQLAACSGGGLLVLDDRSATVIDAGLYQVAHAEGEFPWLVTPGRALRYVDATSGPYFYSVEWSEEEIEFFRGQYLDARNVFSMFGLHHLIRETDRRALVLRSRRVFGGCYLGLGLLTLIAWGMALASGSTVRGGSGKVDGRAVGAQGVRFGPFPLRPEGRVHRLRIHGSMRETSSWIQAVVEDEQEQELFATDRDMWDESGTDSDGYWHESDLSASTDFVVKKAGNYYVRIYSEPDPAGGASPIEAGFELQEKALYPIYLAVFGFTALIIGGIFLMAGSPAAMGKVWEGLQSSDD